MRMNISTKEKGVTARAARAAPGLWVAVLLLFAVCACERASDPNERAPAPRDASMDATLLDVVANEEGVALDLTDAGSDGTPEDILMDSLVLDVRDVGDASDVDVSVPPDVRACERGAVVESSCPTDGRFDRAGVATVTFDNRGAPRVTPIHPSCRLEVFHAVVVHYRPCHRTYLEVSVANPRTTQGLDTVVWVTTGCGRGDELGCNDDGWPGNVTSQLITRRPVNEGEDVYIHVATREGDGGVVTGTIELSVTEVPPFPYGACRRRSDSPNGVCPPGSSCQVDAHGDFCVPDGAPGGLCDSSSPTGARCGSTATCVVRDAGAPSTCVSSASEGIAGTPCRSTEPFCDAELACTGSPGFYAGGRMRRGPLCAPVLAHGAVCSPASEAQACPVGDACIGTDDYAGRCLQAYEKTILPPGRADFIEACDPSLGGRELELDPLTPARVTVPFSFQFFSRTLASGWGLAPMMSGHAYAGTAYEIEYLSYLTGHKIPERVSRIDPFFAPFSGNHSLVTSLVCYRIIGTEPTRRLVVSWRDARQDDRPSVRVSFQMILDEGTSAIEYRYGPRSSPTGADVAFVDGTHATIGMQASVGEVAWHVGTVVASSGIRWTRLATPR